jgi:hypothetical protein
MPSRRTRSRFVSAPVRKKFPQVRWQRRNRQPEFVDEAAP